MVLGTSVKGEETVSYEKLMRNGLFIWFKDISGDDKGKVIISDTWMDNGTQKAHVGDQVDPLRNDVVSVRTVANG